MNIWESLANCKSGAQLRKTTQFCMFGKVWLIVSLVLRRMRKRTHFVNILESLANCKSGARLRKRTHFVNIWEEKGHIFVCV